MATFEKRSGGWRVKVRKAGQSYTATLPTKAAAVDWATKIEADILAGKLGQVQDKSVQDLVDRYIKEVTPHKRGARAEEFRLNRSVAGDFAKVRLPALCPDNIAQWRDKRMQSVSAASVLREWATLSHAFNVAVKEWKWLRENPMANVRKPAAPQPRNRLISADELNVLLHACGDNYELSQARVGLALRFALETAMRAGEICELTWAHVFDKRVHLPKTKNGSSRDVPLSKEAIAILETLRPLRLDPCFGLSAAILDAMFRKAKARALITDIHFHDSRATALTRLSRKLNVMQLAKMSGHRDLRILQNVYYRERAEDIADLL